MKKMPDIPRLVAIGQRMAVTYLGATVETAAVEAFLRDVLFGERELWPGWEEGLITNEELASAVADRTATFLSRHTGRDWPATAREGEYDSLLLEIGAALFES